MKDERDRKIRKQKKAERGKATIFGWNIGSMSSEMQIVYSVLVVAIFAAVFWFLDKKVAEKEAAATGKKDKSKKKK